MNDPPSVSVWPFMLLVAIAIAINVLTILLRNEERMKVVDEGRETMVLVLDFGIDQEVETEDQMFWSLTDVGNVIHIRGCYAHAPAHEGRWLIVEKEGNRIVLQRMP